MPRNAQAHEATHARMVRAWRAQPYPHAQVDDDANVLATTFTKAVIRSRAALTYQEAQVRSI